MKFRTKYDEQEPVISNAGERYKIEYGAQLDKYGNRVIVPKGKIDMKMFINSHAKETDLNLLLAKYQNGDTTALMQRAAMFMDITGIPNNINEVLNLKTQAEKVFNILPAKVKEAFGNNVNNWLSNMNTKEWIEIMSQSEDSVRKGQAKQAAKVTDIYKSNAKNYPEVKPEEVIENPAIDASEENLKSTLKKMLGE